MNCEDLHPDLVAYHFGDVSDELRQRVEVHLLSCSSCLESYLGLKREIETAASGPKPSEMARARIRRSVARQIGHSEPTRPWSWWERPLAFGIAGAAVVGAVFAVNVVASGEGSRPLTLNEPASAPQQQ